MRTLPRRIAILCVMTGAMMLMGTKALAASSPANLETLLEKARSETYAVPPARSIQAAQQGFRHWLAADERLAAARDAEVAGFQRLGYVPAAVSEPGIMALIETAAERRGRGFFAARIEGGTPLMIQAPHQYYDLRTGTLARQLFVESQAMAAAWNTTHRYHNSHDTDLVHIADSYLHALSRAFIDVHPDGRILQLHGFSTAKRDSWAGRRAQAILSNGTRYPTQPLIQLTRCLSQRLGIRAFLYPRDVSELGATTNTLAADLRRRGFDGFVHLELAAELRQRLIAEPATRNLLIQCVTETLR